MTKDPTKSRKKKAAENKSSEAEIIEIAPPQKEDETPPETSSAEALAGDPAAAHEATGEAPDGFAEADGGDLEAVIEDAAFGGRETGEEPESLESEIEEETATVEEMPGAEVYRTPSGLKAAIECLLFTTPHPLSLKRMRALLAGCDPKTLRGAVSQLQMEYDAHGGGLQVIESAEGYQMCTRPQFAEVILRLHQQRKRNPLTMTALETLAIVAYKQPITRAEIEMIRGVESSGVLRNLCDMGLVKVVGRKEVIGRPQLYGTSSVFLRTFGLRSLAELPSIEVLRRQFAAKPVFAASVETPGETGAEPGNERMGGSAGAPLEENPEEEDFEDADEGWEEGEEEESGETGENEEKGDFGERFFEPGDDDDDEDDEDDEDWELDEEDEEDEDEDDDR